MELVRYRKHSQMARGIIPAELVLKNAEVFLAHTEEFYHADVAIADGIIVGIGKYEGLREIDLNGKYLCPGLIDSHLHLESTLVTPGELIYQAALCGTTTFIVDPHESANVSGTDGIDYILKQTEDSPANVYVMLPSCVPATHVDDNGAILTAGKMKAYAEHPRILGLGEVMDAASVIQGNVSMHEKLSLFRNKIKDGHAPFLSEGDLLAYALAGISTDHECVDYEYAMRECRKGIQVLIREGSAARNLEAIVSGIVKNKTEISGFSFCTDDKHIEDIQRDGHINYNIRKSVELGLSAEKAIKMATLNAARCYGLKHLGAIAPGFQADLVVFNNLVEFRTEAVFHKGKELHVLQEIPVQPCAPHLKNTVHILDFSEERLRLEHPGTKARVIQMEQGQITTKSIVAEVPFESDKYGKYFAANKEYQKIAVIERHRYTGKIGVGILKGFGICNGAIASSVSHDSHNIIVAGDNDKDMALAVKELVRTQGGYTIVENGKVYETLPLPIMGLMSDLGYKEVNRILAKMLKKAHGMGIPAGFDPFITLSFMALPVIPEIRITPRGLYVTAWDRMQKTPFSELLSE